MNSILNNIFVFPRKENRASISRNHNKSALASSLAGHLRSMSFAPLREKIEHGLNGFSLRRQTGADELNITKETKSSKMRRLPVIFFTFTAPIIYHIC